MNSDYLLQAMSESRSYTGRVVDRQLEKLHQLFTFYQHSLKDVYEVFPAYNCDIFFVFNWQSEFVSIRIISTIFYV